MPATSTQPVGRGNKSHLEASCARLKQELHTLRKSVTHQQVKQLTERSYEMEDLLISMQDDMEELQQERNAARAEAAALRKKLRERHQQAALAQLHRDASTSAVEESARCQEAFQATIGELKAELQGAHAKLQDAEAANVEMKDQLNRQCHEDEEQRRSCRSLQHQVDHWRRTCSELQESLHDKKEALQKLASPMSMQGLDSPDHLMQVQNLREQLLGAEEHAAGSQQILEALAACRLACSKSECQFNLSTVKPLLLDMSAGQPESNEGPVGSLDELLERLEGHDWKRAEAEAAWHLHHEACQRSAAIAMAALEQQVLRSRALEQMRLADVQELASMQHQLLQCNQTIWDLRSFIAGCRTYVNGSKLETQDEMGSCKQHNSEGSHALGTYPAVGHHLP
ncbi:hypothetical protein WJX84_006901 [Apatococcus fuscideae]|uniref:Uncharacterized protein n=1 Tax=Apatococcus fuscideae TaxID=2026836 RepID=A0AAW1T1P1_9CHLO